MKNRITTYIFNPTTKTVDFSAISGFDISGLLAILNGGAALYAVGQPALTATCIGSVVTLNASVSTAGMTSGDHLTIFYDDAALQSVKLSGTLPAFSATPTINLASPTNPIGVAEVMNETPPNPDSTYALLVRQIAEDNAYTQELLAQIAAVLSNSVNGKGLQVTQLTATNLIMTLSQAVFASNIMPSWQQNGLVVTLNSNFPMNNLPPQHIYGGISV